MARIRSVHPGIFTDEAWASVSVTARWFGVGLATEADDNGIFEWKPLQLKMRLFPADAVDIAALLNEMELAGIIAAFTADGKRYGAIRNFCKYQRPRKPKAWHPLPDDLREFVAAHLPPEPDDEGDEVPSGSEPVPQKSVPKPIKEPPVPPKSEKSPQMEDGGGNRKGKDNPEAAQLYDPRESDAGLRLKALEIRLREAAGWQNEPAPGLCVTGSIDALIQSGASPEMDVFPVIKAKASQAHSRKSWSFFVDPIKDAMAKRLAARAPPSTLVDTEAKRLAAMKKLEEHTAKFQAEQANGNTGRH